MSQEHDEELRNAMLAAFGDDAMSLLDDDMSDLSESTEQSSEENVSPPASSVLPRAEWMAQLCESLYGNASTSSPKSLANESKIIAFQIGNSIFGLRLEDTKEIASFPKTTDIPRSPSWLHGVSNYRGRVLSVLDLRNLLHISDERPVTGQKVIVINDDKDDCLTAIAVDSVIGIRKSGAINPNLDCMNEQFANASSGTVSIDETTATLLDVERLFNMASVANQ